MAKLRKACAYRRLERPYTRISKYREKSFIRARPNIKIVKYDMGDEKKDFNFKVNLLSKANLQIRHNALESARLAANRKLERGAGKGAYHLKLRVYPHHVLRENPLATGAGADRMSTGMKKSFGKTIGTAARVKEGQALATIRIDKAHEKIAMEALRVFRHKVPCQCMVEVVEA